MEGKRWTAKGQCWGLKRRLCLQEILPACLQSALVQNTQCGSSRRSGASLSFRGSCWELGLAPLPHAQPAPVALVRQGLLEVCPGWGSVPEERREGLGDALENVAHTSCCKWSIHHGASWLVCCAAVLVPPPDMECCAVSGLKIEETPKYTP